MTYYFRKNHKYIFGSFISLTLKRLLKILRRTYEKLYKKSYEVSKIAPLPQK